jgi:hypothetical protein
MEYDLRTSLVRLTDAVSNLLNSSIEFVKTSETHGETVYRFRRKS